MALTRANCETVIVKRLKVLMEVAGLAVTYAGSNTDLGDPISWALRRLGGAVADATTVTDAELTAVATADWDDLFNLAEYRTLQTILGNLDLVDISAGPRSERSSQLAQQVRGMIEAREAFVDAFVNPPTAGYITMDFACHGE